MVTIREKRGENFVKSEGNVPRTTDSLLERFSEEDVWRSTPFVPSAIRNARQCCTCLVTCSFASSCWIAAGIVGVRHEGASFAGWLRMFVQKLDEEGVCKTAMLCWAIWRARNELIWKKIKMTVNEVVTMARIELDQWRNAKENGIMPSFSISDSWGEAECWSKIDGNTIKVNVDAAIFPDSEFFDVGWVARGHDSRLNEGGTLTKGGSISPGVVEVIGVREALSWIKSKGWNEVIVEMDCLEVVQSARIKVATPSYFRSIIS